VTNYVGLEVFGSWGDSFQDASPNPLEGAKRQFVSGANDPDAGAKLSIPVIPVLRADDLNSRRCKAE
jgi:hypothetical protein